MEQPAHETVDLQQASAERLQALFATWPSIDQPLVGLQLRVLLADRVDCAVRVIRRGRSLIVQELGSGGQVQLLVPRGF